MLHAILIPAYGPTAGLISLLRTLRGSCNFPIVLVNDGSGPEFSAVFKDAADIEGLVLLENAINLGKGAAIKHGVNFILVKYPSAKWIITADADGQHIPIDILAVANASEDNTLVLGCRKFGGGVPFRSRFGNTVSKYIYRMLTSIELEDTQTGLRSIPRPLAEACLRNQSNRYEFETEQLIAAKRMDLKFKQVPIETVYIDDNRSSHFDPVFDSFKIYFVLLRYAVSSMITVAADFAVFVLLAWGGASVMTANMLGLVIAMFVQFVLLRQYVFKTQAGVGAFLGFVCYALVSRYVSAVLQVQLASELRFQPVVAKIMVDGAIFLINFLFLRDIVFRRRSEG